MPSWTAGPGRRWRAGACSTMALSSSTRRAREALVAWPALPWTWTLDCPALACRDLWSLVLPCQAPLPGLLVLPVPTRPPCFHAVQGRGRHLAAIAHPDPRGAAHGPSAAAAGGRAGETAPPARLARRPAGRHTAAGSTSKPSCRRQHKQQTAQPPPTPPHTSIYPPQTHTYAPNPGASPQFDQVTVNEYPPGVGLSPHIDTHSAFTGAIASLSLAGHVAIVFRRGQEQRALALPPRSLLVFAQEARYAW